MTRDLNKEEEMKWWQSQFLEATKEENYGAMLSAQNAILSLRIDILGERVKLLEEK